MLRGYHVCAGCPIPGLEQKPQRSLSNLFGLLSNFLGFVTSQHWFWFLSGLSVGVIIGVWLRKLLAKVEAEKTTLQIDYEGEGANKVETPDDSSFEQE